MTLLGLDIGTTHCKAGLFGLSGEPLFITGRPMPIRHQAPGGATYDPQTLWKTVAEIIRELSGRAEQPIAVVGIASMAETGLLLDPESGTARSSFLPWFDPSAAAQAARLREAGDPQSRFARTGIYPSFKNSLAKILWLREQEPGITRNSRWLSVADYIGYRLTGEMGTDPSLAGRTYAFSLPDGTWDEAWLQEFDLSPALFPPVVASGRPLGGVQQAMLGLARGTPVAVSGHDHICAASALGVLDPGPLFDSMGTAEALFGALEPRALGTAEYESGLTFGYHTAPGRFYWLGGLSASGGSLEWLRRVLGNPPLSYEALQALSAALPAEPGQLLYLPYLSGSGSPWSDPDVAGAFIGLRPGHGRPALLKAVLEGTAYQIEAIRRAAVAALGTAQGPIIAAGGGTRNRPWLQIKADVTGCPHHVSAVTEATALGAALVAAAGSGLVASLEEAVAAAARPPAAHFEPDPARHEQYRRLYTTNFLAWQQPLRQYARGELRPTGDFDA